MYVIQEDGNKFESLLVAPLSVLLEYRDHGVGSALMKEGLRRGRELGYKAAFLCGDPEYYHRFGFKSIREFGLTNPEIPEPYATVSYTHLDVYKRQVLIYQCDN